MIMMNQLVAFYSVNLGFLFPFLNGTEANQETMIRQRVYAHLLIQDLPSAKDEVLQGLKLYPNSQPLYEACIRTFAHLGDELGMLMTWNQYVAKFPDQQTNREVLESIAWGVIDKAAISNSPVTRIMAMLGAFFSQDVKGIDILQKKMSKTPTLY